jgi:hypothetical protein
MTETLREECWGFEPLRPFRWRINGVRAAVVYDDEGQFGLHRVFYGDSWWSSKAFWLVPPALPQPTPWPCEA